MLKKGRVYKSTLVRKQEIIEAAGNVIVKYGSERLTIRRISKEVGIAEGTIYKHVKSKGEILALLAEYIGNMLMEDIERNRVPSCGSLETLDNILKSQFIILAKTKVMAFQIIAEIVRRGEKQLNKKIADIIDDYTNLIKDILSQGVENGEIREDIDLDAVAGCFFSIVQGLSCRWIMNDYQFDLQKRSLPLRGILQEVLIKP